MRFAHIATALFAIILPLPVLGQQAISAPIMVSADTAVTKLPSAVRKRIAIGAAPSEVLALLKAQPSLILDGATLSVDAPPIGSSQTLSLNRLELRNGARIVTNGINLEINALQIVPGSGQIVSFDSAAGKLPPTAADQSNGASGSSAGTLVLNAALDRTDVLNVSLHGQDGQSGGKGAPGPTGAPGTRGDNGADHLFDCARGGGNGGAGSQGGPGGKGGSGGNGGDGGRLILRNGIATQRMQVNFVAPGGKEGDGGKAGAGGPGGPGGPGGSGTFYCRGGSAGSNGAQGLLGAPGEKGKPGATGTVTVD